MQEHWLNGGSARVRPHETHRNLPLRVASTVGGVAVAVSASHFNDDEGVGW